MTERPLTGDPIERFLADAERAARRGDRELALDLIVLALDTAPSDPAVLVRAHAIRAMLPAAPEAGAQPHPVEPVVAPPTAPRPEMPAAPNFDPIASPARDAGDLFVPLPDLGEVRLDSYEEDVEFLLKPRPSETESASAVPKPASPRGRGKVVYLLWILLAFGLIGALVVSTNPGAIDAISATVRRTYDPFAKAEHLSSTGRHEDVIALIQERFADLTTSQQVPARLMLAEAFLATADTSAAERELAQAISRDTGWRNAIAAARLLARAGSLTEAAGAYLLAFERGAPQEQWDEIAEGQEAAGRTDQAQHIRQLINRESGATEVVVTPDSVEIEPTQASPDSSQQTI